MKKLILIISAVFILSCNNNSNETTVHDTSSAKVRDTSSSKAEVEPKDDSLGLRRAESNFIKWKIDKNLAEDMTRGFLEMPCEDPYTITDYNPEIYKKIRDEYSKPGYSDVKIEFVKAKHVNTSRMHYGWLRGFFPLARKTNVNNFCTEIVKVSFKKDRRTVSEEEYYDIATICPPPRGENCLRDNRKRE